MGERNGVEYAALGLKWDDTDWIAGQIHVRRTFNHGRFYEPKSKTSRRKINLAHQLISQVKEWQLACPPSKPDLVFPNGEGKTIDANNLVKREFLQTLQKAKISRINLHLLRHTYASLLIDQDENPKYIQAQMRH